MKTRSVRIANGFYVRAVASADHCSILELVIRRNPAKSHLPSLPCFGNKNREIANVSCLLVILYKFYFSVGLHFFYLQFFLQELFCSFSNFFFLLRRKIWSIKKNLVL